MDSIHSILVHVDGGVHAGPRLEHARALAVTLEARVEALFAVSPPFAPLPGFGAPGVPLLNEADPEARRRARASFDRVSSGAGGPLRWNEVEREEVVAGFARYSLYADLMLLGQHDLHDDTARNVPGDFVESVIMTSGTPAIVTPRGGAVVFTGYACILVAWQPTREAARALKAALPLLQRAAEVHLVNGAADEAERSSCLADAAGYLRLHGVEGVRLHGDSDWAGADEAPLTVASGLGADLLVMGCYGHSRTRERVLGGASRTVLQQAMLPVLMAH